MAELPDRLPCTIIIRGTIPIALRGKETGVADSINAMLQVGDFETDQIIIRMVDAAVGAQREATRQALLQRDSVRMSVLKAELRAAIGNTRIGNDLRQWASHLLNLIERGRV